MKSAETNWTSASDIDSVQAWQCNSENYQSVVLNIEIIPSSVPTHMMLSDSQITRFDVLEPDDGGPYFGLTGIHWQYTRSRYLPPVKGGTSS